MAHMEGLGALSNPRTSAMLTLNGTNHKQWVESLMMNLTLMRVDLALRTDAPPKPTDDTTEKDRKSYEDWEHSNRCCLMLMRYHMDESIRDSIPQIEIAKDFLAAIKEKYKKFSKNEKNECLTLFHRTNYANSGDIRSHIDKLMGCYQKLKGMGLDLGEDYMVWFVMETIPSQFDSIRSSYNAQKEQWTIEEMTAILAKEEEDMKKGKARSISMITNPSNSQKRKSTSNNSSDQRPSKKKCNHPKGNGQGSSSSTGHKNEYFQGKCNFYQCFEHKKVDCRKLKAHLEKKGKCLVLVCLESNIIGVPSNTWWLDTGATIHVTNSLQAVTNRRRPNSLEECVYMGDDTKVRIEFFGTVRLQLNTGHFWNCMKLLTCPLLGGI
ncbi:uncharacterized protein LOC133797221 [Humulus lupulus]|uniref:uncharacterized protein LOC133797221 n=1 Tax=Humulus lupulus TaxID=3486 RepID=UPI002B40B35F|nr:uncharacterized protein LOC133797221 [Humulus lupulus]